MTPLEGQARVLTSLTQFASICAMEVTREGIPVYFSSRLVCYFVENLGIALSRDRILHDVWGHDVTSTRTVDVHVTPLS